MALYRPRPLPTTSLSGIVPWRSVHSIKRWNHLITSDSDRSCVQHLLRIWGQLYRLTHTHTHGTGCKSYHSARASAFSLHPQQQPKSSQFSANTIHSGSRTGMVRRNSAIACCKTDGAARRRRRRGLQSRYQTEQHQPYRSGAHGQGNGSPLSCAIKFSEGLSYL